MIVFACLMVNDARAAVFLDFDANNATETHNGGAALTAKTSVDGVASGGSRGWAISSGTGANGYASQSAVFPLASPFEMIYPITFDFDFNDPGGSTNQILGRFELYTTTAGSPTASSPESIWTLLEPTVSSFTSTNGLQFDVDGGRATYSSGSVPDFDAYSLSVASPDLSGPVTAFRLKALADDNYPSDGPNLPSPGPGLRSDGNFVLSGFAASSESPQLAADIATFIRSDSQTTNFDDSSHGLIIGSASSGGTRIRGLLGFDLSQLPDDPNFNHVEVDLTVHNLDGSGGGAGSVLEGSTWDLLGVTYDAANDLYFTEDQATWRHRDKGASIFWTTYGGDFDATPLASVTLGWEPVVGDTITLTGTDALASAVSNAIAADETLYFILKQADEGTNAARRFMFVHSESTGGLEAAPMLRLMQVPEPSSLLLLGLGLVSGMLWRRRNGR